MTRPLHRSGHRISPWDARSSARDDVGPGRRRAAEHRRGRGRRGDGGFVSAWTVALAVATWGLVGLTHDGARAVRARSDAFGAAASAARVGATAIDREASVQGIALVDRELARQRAGEFLQQQGHDGSVVVTDDQIRVTVRGTTEFTILPGSSSYEVTASAQIVQGTGDRQAESTG
jgi:hypothetical protein